MLQFPPSQPIRRALRRAGAERPGYRRRFVRRLRDGVRTNSVRKSSKRAAQGATVLSGFLVFMGASLTSAGRAAG